ncbi:MAG: hypothetical protein ACYDCL_00415 [Myxococcales bacterium]
MPEVTNTAAGPPIYGGMPAGEPDSRHWSWKRFGGMGVVEALGVWGEYHSLAAQMLGFVVALFALPLAVIAALWTVTPLWRPTRVRRIVVAEAWWAVVLLVSLALGSVFASELPSHEKLQRQFRASRSAFEALEGMVVEDHLEQFSLHLDGTITVHPDLSGSRFGQYKHLMDAAGIKRLFGFKKNHDPVTFELAGRGWLKTSHAGILWYPPSAPPRTLADDYEHCTSSELIEPGCYSYRSPYCGGSIRQQREGAHLADPAIRMLLAKPLEVPCEGGKGMSVAECEALRQRQVWVLICKAVAGPRAPNVTRPWDYYERSRFASCMEDFWPGYRRRILEQDSAELPGNP